METYSALPSLWGMVVLGLGFSWGSCQCNVISEVLSSEGATMYLMMMGNAHRVASRVGLLSIDSEAQRKYEYPVWYAGT